MQQAKSSTGQKAGGAVGETRKPVTIKKYANRRLYNTETSTYVTLDDLAEMVKRERDFVVYDAKTGEDLTHSVLTQIILEQEGRGQNLLPINFLRQLIRFYGDNLGRLVPSYLDFSMGMLTREQEKFRKQMTDAWGVTPFGANPFGTAAFEAMQEQARQNMAMFDKALSMFTPFGHRPKVEEPEPPVDAREERPADLRAERELRQGAQPPAASAELDQLREQMAAMQRQLDRLAKGDR